MQAMDAKVPREVPVAWFGVASEVRLMGSFDGWTRGVDLSADDISDSVFTRFEATVLLLPVNAYRKSLSVGLSHRVFK